MSLSGYETPRYSRKRRFRENVFSGKSRLNREHPMGGYIAHAKIVTDFARNLLDDWGYWETV